MRNIKRPYRFTTNELKYIGNMAIAVRRKFDEDTTRATDDYYVMLHNCSMPRLDMFGVSTAKVRKSMSRYLPMLWRLHRLDAFRLAAIHETRKTAS